MVKESAGKDDTDPSDSRVTKKPLLLLMTQRHEKETSCGTGFIFSISTLVVPGNGQSEAHDQVNK